jgi:serine/threonine-protein kinase
MPIRLADLEIVEMVATGPRAEVFRARLGGTACAVKKILPQFTRTAEFVQLITEGVRRAALLRHPNIVQVLDLAVNEAGDYFVVSEFVDGKDLADVMYAAQVKGYTLGPAAAMTLVEQILEALHCALSARDRSGQALNLTHGRLSAHNIMLSNQGTVRVTDFGFANVFQRGGHPSLSAGARPSSPARVSSDARVDHADAHADVHRVGFLLVEMLCGERVAGAYLQSLNTDQAHSAADLRLLSGETCPPGIVQFVRRGLARNPEERFPNAASMLMELRQKVQARAIPIGADLARIQRDLFGTAKSESPKVPPRTRPLKLSSVPGVIPVVDESAPSPPTAARPPTRAKLSSLEGGAPVARGIVVGGKNAVALEAGSRVMPSRLPAAHPSPSAASEEPRTVMIDPGAVTGPETRLAAAALAPAAVLQKTAPGEDEKADKTRLEPPRLELDHALRREASAPAAVLPKQAPSQDDADATRIVSDLSDPGSRPVVTLPRLDPSGSAQLLASSLRLRPLGSVTSSANKRTPSLPRMLVSAPLPPPLPDISAEIPALPRAAPTAPPPLPEDSAKLPVLPAAGAIPVVPQGQVDSSEMRAFLPRGATSPQANAEGQFPQGGGHTVMVMASALAAADQLLGDAPAALGRADIAPSPLLSPAPDPSSPEAVSPASTDEQERKKQEALARLRAKKAAAAGASESNEPLPPPVPPPGADSLPAEEWRTTPDAPPSAPHPDRAGKVLERAVETYDADVRPLARRRAWVIGEPSISPGNPAGPAKRGQWVKTFFPSSLRRAAVVTFALFAAVTYALAAEYGPETARLLGPGAAFLFEPGVAARAAANTSGVMMVVRSSPAGVRITLDGEELGMTPLVVTRNLAPGAHTWSAEHAGQHKSQELLLVPGQDVVSFFMGLDPADSLDVRTDLDGADVWVDQRNMGPAPVRLDHVGEHDHLVQIRQGERLVHAQLVRALDDKPRAVDVPAGSAGAGAGTVVIQSNPVAWIEVDGVQLSRFTGAEPLQLPPGKHRLVLSVPLLGLRKEVTLDVGRGPSRFFVELHD